MQKVNGSPGYGAHGVIGSGLEGLVKSKGLQIYNKGYRLR